MIDMKNLRLIVIVVIFAIVSTPALAIPDFRAGAIAWRQSLFESTIPTPTIPLFFNPLPEMKSTLPTIVVPTPTTTESEYDGDIIYEGYMRLFDKDLQWITPTPLDSDDDNGGPIKLFPKSPFKTKLPKIPIP
ncbi:MAG TPA: hypothetical protein PLN32_01880 [Methanoregulaceae archaeon]|nr:hypothetical protein [Methanoregulaceae archaeon]